MARLLVNIKTHKIKDMDHVGITLAVIRFGRAEASPAPTILFL